MERNVRIRAYTRTYVCARRYDRGVMRAGRRSRWQRGRERKPGAGGGRPGAERSGRVQEWIAEFLE